VAGLMLLGGGGSRRTRDPAQTRGLSHIELVGFSSAPEMHSTLRSIIAKSLMGRGALAAACIHKPFVELS
jgi:hypothetical protein